MTDLTFLKSETKGLVLSIAAVEESVGLAAVAGFLFIVFIMLIANRLMKKNRGEEEQEKEGIHKVVEEVMDEDEKQTSF
ncbi:unnamed protein product [Boreogadus saida]